MVNNEFNEETNKEEKTEYDYDFLGKEYQPPDFGKDFDCSATLNLSNRIAFLNEVGKIKEDMRSKVIISYDSLCDRICACAKNSGFSFNEHAIVLFFNSLGVLDLKEDSDVIENLIVPFLERTDSRKIIDRTKEYLRNIGMPNSQVDYHDKSNSFVSKLRAKREFIFRTKLNPEEIFSIQDLHFAILNYEILFPDSPYNIITDIFLRTIDEKTHKDVLENVVLPLWKQYNIKAASTVYLKYNKNNFTI